MNLPALTVLNLYTLNAPAEAFVAAITALAARVQAEGAPGVLSYRFFVNPTDATARAVIDYADPQAWIGHHDLSMTWPEMKALHHAATLSEATFLGDFTPEIQAWLAASRLTARITSGFSSAAGFQRPSNT